MKKLAFILILFSTSIATAQLSDKAYLLKYKEAVQMYASHDFEKAMVSLAPLTGTAYSNVIQPYTMFYFALSAFEADKLFQSREMLRRLFVKYPDWEKNDEAYYLYANANFADEYFEEGLGSLNKVLSKDIKEKSQGMLKTYFKDVSDVGLLKELIKKFPNNRIIAEHLVNLIQAQPYNRRQDLELSDVLTNRFDFKEVKKAKVLENNKANYRRSSDNQPLEFGVLLPFQLDLGDSEQIKNQYVYDLFLGMKIAAEDIEKEGIPVRVFGIDVGPDPLSIKEHIEDENFKQMDVVFGPLYAKPNRVINKYINQNKIIQVHPISNNSSLIKNEPFVFLNQPSFQKQAEKTIEFVDEKDWKQSCIVFHDGGRKSQILANAYQEMAEKKGFKVLYNVQASMESDIEVTEPLGHVFLVGDVGFYSMASRLMSKVGITAPILATSSSVDYERVSRASLKGERYLLYPDFVDYSKGSVKDFQAKFVNQLHRPASYYSFLGYDMVRLYAMILKEGKEVFRLNMNNSSSLQGFTTEGFDYAGGSNENLVVPIVKWNIDHFETVN